MVQRAAVGQQLSRSVKLGHVTAAHHQHAVAVGDGVDAVSDRQHRARRELGAYRSLDDVICVPVNRRCGLVDAQNLKPTAKCNCFEIGET